MDLREPILDLKGVFKFKRVDLGLLEPISGLKEPDYGLRDLVGGMYGQMYGWMDAQTDG